MTQYIDKSAALAEVENIKSIEFNEGTPSDNYACMALDMVIETLDTLEVKEVDLKEEVERFAKECGYKSAATIDFQFAKHFFELGLKAQKGE